MMNSAFDVHMNMFKYLAANTKFSLV